jgi:hypothetical protein
MALVTQTIVEFDNGNCVWSYEYDDVALRLTRLMCTNNSAFATRGTITVDKNGRTFSRTVNAGSSLNVNIPTGPQARLEITIDSRGRVDGIDWSFAWPA